jgi:hypothetical protein
MFMIKASGSSDVCDDVWYKTTLLVILWKVTHSMSTSILMRNRISCFIEKNLWSLWC